MTKTRRGSRQKAREVPAWGDEPMRIDPRVFERRVGATRPQPGSEVADDAPERFTPDEQFATWIRDTFISADGPLANGEYEHLIDARIGVLWTNAINVRQQRHVLATAEMPQTMGGRWKRGRAEQQLRDWFECEVDFLLTFYAPDCNHLDDRSFCALVEHELLHCAQDLDRYGAPRFDRMGRPIYAIRGHDSEEFTSVVRRYGIGAVSQGTRDLINAAKLPPLIGDAAVSVACGVCAAMAA